ncbi:alkaline phosphatase [Marininema halotolerans]|uniref:Alkaline phosphatase n=1 Tax=Marininema halotolerans TaxID=1155944 RepID=A0A1I6RZQ7_9BACL|nr:alkaline phosphatase [Marininema halotolerans]SFS70193.1 alkaline phosphatase [Marininema halotolerans]
MVHQKKRLVLCISLLMVSLIAPSPSQAIADHALAQNVIFLIPDGFSSSQATSYRWFKGKNTLFDSLLVGMHRTHSASSKVTDSAAAATAMATGSKTRNGMIGVNPQGHPLSTILEAARQQGKATGLVSTSTITHATPASFAAHIRSRQMEQEIAQQLIPKVDLLLGGGRQYFLPQSSGGKQSHRNLIQEAKNKGYQYIATRNQLIHSHHPRVLGLFANGPLSPELERSNTQEPSLSEMTTHAIQTLSPHKKGFFLMVEGSQIDFAGHVHDAAWSMHDIAAFEKAVQVAIHFAKKDGNTLVVIAGDHETGGMSVGGYNQYHSRIELLKKVTLTGKSLAKKLASPQTNAKQLTHTYTGLDLTTDEIKRIHRSSHPELTINDIISNHALIGWTTRVHTGGDVPVYAFGTGSHLFYGLHDNTDLPKLMAKAMNIPFPVAR